MEALIFHNPILFTLFSIIIIVFLKWLTSTPKVKKNLPPSPRGIPIFGNLLQLGVLPHHSMHSLSQKHGPIMLLRFGKIPTVVISSAEGAKEIMKTHDLVFADRPYSSVADRLLYSMKDIAMAPYGEYWRQLKSISVLQLLSNKKVEAFRSIRAEEIAQLVKNIRESCLNSNPVNLSEIFTAFTNDVVSRSALGKKHGEGPQGTKNKGLINEFAQLLGTTYLGPFVPWLEWINRFNGFNARIDRVAREIDRFLEEVIEERLRNGFDEKKHGESGEDFLNILLRIYKDTESEISMERDSLKGVILDVFAAGTDTTALVSEWVMTELIRHPNVMKKLQTEVRGVIQGKHDITDSNIEEMHYLKAVLKETFRLHPPIPLLLPREARQDSKIMGYDIAAKTMVIINTWAIGRDPLIWDEPEEFKPERFLNSCVDYKGHDFELTPFGAGRRGCPGISFAMSTTELALATLLHEFDWSLPNGANGKYLDVDERPGVSNRRKNPLLAVAVPTNNGVSPFELSNNP
uniref:CYP4 n=1 Tax=Gentiana crassa subsp. rigescens TaxID=3097545 RepID=A0A2Z0N1Z7_9GENT|nr:CYP4 [Gentiana rigescens]